MITGARDSTTVVAGYRVVRRIRKSSLYEVYDAWSEEREARCVIKVLRPERRDSDADRRRVEREGALLLSLSHPHIVRAYEVHADPIPFIVLEAAPGATLARLIEEGPFTLRDLARLATQLCSALAYLHRRGYLHLDLKPSNIACDRGYVRLLDLSIARPPGSIARGVGTARYLSSEQACGDVLTEATDVWGLGCVLYGAATGREPFDGSDRTVAQAPLRARRRRLRSATESTILGCLSAAPGDRPTISEVTRTFAPLV